MRDKRDRVIVCVFRRDLHLTLMFSGLLQKRSVWGLGFSVWGNFFSSNKTVVTLVTQGLPSSLISRPVAEEGRRRVYLLWFNYILGTNFIFLCFKLIIFHYHN